MKRFNECTSCTKVVVVLCCGSFLILIGFLIGMLSFQRIWERHERAEGSGEEVRVNDGRYAFINPLLECSISDDYIGTNEGKPSREKLINLIEQDKKNGDASEVSVYFRNLNDGPWVGVSEKKWFAPASLLKVPLMMIMLRSSETDPNYLSRKIQADTSENSGVKPYFNESGRLESGKEYTYQELMEAMIIHSDNDATQTILKSIVTLDQVESLFKELRIEETASEAGNGISVKDYGMFLRVLFNASYLSKDTSEKALRLLSQSTFTKGLVAGVAPGVTVSHKFGERVQGDIKQLHDCGIVYLPKQPYLLCVMTRGKDFDRLATVISSISKLVYNDLMMSTDN